VGISGWIDTYSSANKDSEERTMKSKKNNAKLSTVILKINKLMYKSFKVRGSKINFFCAVVARNHPFLITLMYKDYSLLEYNALQS
jgi:hypothetical protein